MTKPSKVDVAVTRTFSHSPERVFDAWLTKDVARKFLFATKGGISLHAEMHGHAGGAFRFTERRTKDDGSTWDADHVGFVVEVERPRRIVLSFCAGHAPCTYEPSSATRIQIDVVPTVDGGASLASLWRREPHLVPPRCSARARGARGQRLEPHRREPSPRPRLN